MNLVERINHITTNYRGPMASSAQCCVCDAVNCMSRNMPDYADQRIEKAAQYLFGFGRPSNW